jgi:serine/threonine kinase PknH
MESLTAEDPPSLGGYELRARLGEGGFGLVYLALSPGGRAFAIKVLRREFARDREFLGRFRLEVAAAQRVNGIYTAPVVAAGLDDIPPWVATAFVPGPPLNDIVSQFGPLPEPALWRLLAGLVEALQAIHACGIVHRDLKPANVLLAADGPRVIDFGISKAAGGTSMTSTGSVFGTPGFMAPEQAEGKTVGPATDIFALGCILAYASAGVPPFGGGSVASVLYRVVHSAPVLDGIPPYLRGIVEMCLAKDPAGRPGLYDLAGIGRDGPEGRLAGHSAASFWPPQFARLIRDYQDRLEAAIMTSNTMVGRHSAAHLASPPLPVAGATHPPTAAPPTPPPARDLPWNASPPGYARTGTAGHGANYPGTWPPQPAPPFPQFQQPYPAGSSQQPFQAAPSQFPPQPYPAGAPQFPPQPYPVGPPQFRPPYVQPGGWQPNRVMPGTIRSAITVMFVGAGLAALSAISVLFRFGLAYHYAGTLLFNYRGLSAYAPASFSGAFLYIVECGLWLLIASQVKEGRDWARLVGTALLAVQIILVIVYRLFRANLFGFAQHLVYGGYEAEYMAIDTLGGLLTVLIGVTGCVAVVLLWLRPSWPYFRSR